MDPRDARLARYAARQHGVFSRRQALSSGYTRWAIERRVANGQWESLDSGAYRIAVATPPDARQVLTAAVLATGGVASRRSAAALEGWVPFPDPPEVTVRKGRRPITTACAHTTDTLPKGDVVIVDGIPCTSPARTVIDLGGVLPLLEFEDVLDRALFTHAVRRHRLETRARELRAPRRPGAALVLRLLADRNPEMRNARSIWEARLVREFDRRKLPKPRVNYPVRIGGKRRVLDLAWPELGVYAELDGRAYHLAARAFEDDRTRQNLLSADEWLPFRLTVRALEPDADAALAPLVRTLRRRARGSCSRAP